MSPLNPSINRLDLEALRLNFPILERKVKNQPLIYLDNAATTQKPKMVLDAIANYYTGYNANIHRGVHTLADEATAAYEAARSTVQQFIGAKHAREVIFTRGTTEGINLVAASWGKQHLSKGDEVLISAMEHHANIVPWQLICEERGAVLKVIPITDEGTLCLTDFYALLSVRTKLVAVTHASNALGTINDVSLLIKAAHEAGAVVLLDGAQAAAHLPVNVQELDCDFYAFSGHKIYGPTGIGILYGKEELLSAMPVYQSGGEMIKEVTFERTTFNELPYKFEAGTPNIAGAIGLKAAIDFRLLYDKGDWASHERAILKYAGEALSTLPGLRIIGPDNGKVSLISFIVNGAHPQDIGILLDNQGVAVRCGHHCTQPLMQRLGLTGTVRASFAIYNTFEDIDRFVMATEKTIKMLL